MTNNIYIEITKLDLLYKAMNMNKIIILASSLLGILGIAGLMKATYTNQATSPVAIMPQHHRTRPKINKQRIGEPSATKHSNLNNHTKLVINIKSN